MPLTNGLQNLPTKTALLTNCKTDKYNINNDSPVRFNCDGKSRCCVSEQESDVFAISLGSLSSEHFHLYVRCVSVVSSTDVLSQRLSKSHSFAPSPVTSPACLSAFHAARLASFVLVPLPVRGTNRKWQRRRRHDSSTHTLDAGSEAASSCNAHCPLHIAGHLCACAYMHLVSFGHVLRRTTCGSCPRRANDKLLD